MSDEECSRWLNYWTYGGDPAETFCSRVYRWRWLVPLLWLWIDVEAMRRAGEPWGHCLRARENDRLRRRLWPDEPDAAFRMAQE